ncbi:protein-L-isoaspartate(D-aspartate) O-methyltransferase [Phenylobacterium sp. LjRoot219]|uniref:protein-L-isoaspartate(D-aspartate) O-methyltransferase n=1 Tax=Phenylobacterium sp. LjRoot219 TaxID=3342283 RepID=UPI003ECCDE15
MLANLVAAVALLAAPAAAAEPAASQRSRDAMVANIEQLAAAGALGPSRRLDGRVLAAMREVPRHRFVPKLLQPLAYSDTALPIGHGSTISQPFIVAVMTDVAAVQPGDRVLEVGAGSGYQAAILATLGAEVYTVEIVPQLATSAAARLRELGYTSVKVRAGDGYKGWPEHAPFDAILVTAGATRIPQPLVQQLKPTGRMVIPAGDGGDHQQLTIVTKAANGAVQTRRLGAVAFVPLREPGR